jgi:hypothetical protein
VEDGVGRGHEAAEITAGEVERDELEVVPAAREVEVAQLLAAAVVVVEAVDADHVHAVGQERFGQLRADEARAAGDESGVHAGDRTAGATGGN